MIYDVAIIGGGIGGLMTAYRLKQNNPELSVAIFERGTTLENRKCPASSEQKCLHCKTCSITSGYAGAGVVNHLTYNGFGNLHRLAGIDAVGDIYHSVAIYGVTYGT